MPHQISLRRIAHVQPNSGRETWVDLVVVLDEAGWVERVDIPLFDLPMAVRKLSLPQNVPALEDRIRALAAAAKYHTLLVLTGQRPATGEFSSLAGREVPTPADSAPDPGQAWFAAQLQNDPTAAILALHALTEDDGTTMNQRMKALRFVLRAHDHGALRFLEELLPLAVTDRLRRELIRCYRYLPDEEERAFLLRQLTAPRNEKWAAAVVDALEPIGGEDVYAAIQANLERSNHPDPNTWVALTRWVAQHQYRPAEATLKSLLLRPEQRVVRAATQALLRLGVPPASLIEHAATERQSSKHSDRIAAWSVLSVLAQQKHLDEEWLWQNFLADLRAYPLLAVEYIGPILLNNIQDVAWFRPKLLRHFENDHSAVRQGMLFLLERLKNRNDRFVDEEIILGVVRLLTDPEGGVRRTVGHLLSGLLRRRLSPAVTTLLLEIYANADRRPQLRLAIVGAWIVMFQHANNDYDERVTSPLLDSLSSENRSLRLAAYRVLLQSPDPDVQASVRERKTEVLRK